MKFFARGKKEYWIMYVFAHLLYQKKKKTPLKAGHVQGI